MKKKIYIKPKSAIFPFHLVLMQDTSTITENVHPDDPQPPSGAMSRKITIWNDEDE